MRQKLIRFSKITLILVLLGFFMPVSCDINGKEIIQNSYDLASSMRDYFIAFCCVAVFLFPLLSLFISIITLLFRKDDSLFFSWFCLLLSIAGGVKGYYEIIEGWKSDFQSGAYCIIIGWCLSLLLLFVASSVPDEDTENLGDL